MKLEKRLELLVRETVEEMAAYCEKLNHKTLGFIDIDIDDWVVETVSRTKRMLIEEYRLLS